MKRKTIIAPLTALLLTGCGNFLNVQPQGYVIPSTDEEFAAILHGILREVEGGGDDLILGNMETIALREGCADDLDANLKIGSIPSFAGNEINHRMSDYRETYATIRDCNIVIENMEGRSSEESQNMLSCAYAIKGICYFNLMREFCGAWDADGAAGQPGLVLVDKFDISAHQERSSLRATGDYVLAQLRKSLEIGQKDAKYFFTEWIVKSYVARTQFWCEQWGTCLATCNDILEHSGLAITARKDYEEMIQAQYDIKGEVITRSHINNSSELDWFFSYEKGYIRSRPASASLIALFGSDPSSDIRYTVGFNDKRICVKTPESRIRLSEILLMAAECNAHLGHADRTLALLNELRSKRIEGAETLTEDTLPAVRTDNRIVADAEGKALTPLMQAVFDERRRELFLEGDRWWELKRNGSPEWWIIADGLKYTTKEYLYTAPIYKADVDVYEIKQNAGYEN